MHLVLSLAGIVGFLGLLGAAGSQSGRTIFEVFDSEGSSRPEGTTTDAEG